MIRRKGRGIVRWYGRKRNSDPSQPIVAKLFMPFSISRTSHHGFNLDAENPSSFCICHHPCLIRHDDPLTILRIIMG